MYWLIKTVSKLFCILPAELSLSIGGLLGYLTFLFSGGKKARALRNLKLVFPEKDCSELLNIVKKSFRNFGMSMIETLRVSKEIKDTDSNTFTIEGKQYLTSIEQGGGIFTGIHMGSWEALNVSLAKKLPYAIVVRRQKNRDLDRFLNNLRIMQGLNIVYEDDLKSLIGYIKKDYILGLVFDHGSRDSRIYSEFFGKIIPVPIGALKLALNFKKKIYPGCMTRLDRMSHKLKFFPPLEVKSRDDFAGVARNLNKYFEGFLRENPEDYLWWYKRFKRSKNLNILVLSDKKAGHLKQSLSLAAFLQHKRPGSCVEIADVSLPRFKRFILDVFNLFCKRSPMAIIRRLRLILGKDFESVYKYADIIISCGSNVSSLNRLLSVSQDAKSFVIQKPNVGLDKSDLVILPFHDKAPCLKNIVRIKGSLAVIRDKELRENRKKLKDISNIPEDNLPKIGVFIGGPLRKGHSKDYVLGFLDTLREVCAENTWQLFITTSRRTPLFLEEFLEQHFKDSCLLVIANKENFPFVSLGIIALCDILLVSSDSISMITEAASVKPTLVFDAFGINSKKHLSFLEDVSGEDYVRKVDISNLEDTVKRVISKNIVLKKIDNRQIIEEALNKKL